MAIKKNKVAKSKTKKKKIKIVKVSVKKTKTKKKVLSKKSLNNKRSKKTKTKSKSTNKINKREVTKMSTETIKGGVSASLDTSHLKVPFPFKAKYGNYIGGKFVEPKSGKYFDNVSPINKDVICQMARSDAKDVDAALDAAHEAFKAVSYTHLTLPTKRIV